MNSLEEAQELSKRVNAALDSMQRLEGRGNKITESEVQFRYEAIVGMLIMAQNDIFTLIKEWKK